METGYVEGRNVVIDFRFAHSDVGRLPELAADLVRRRVAVIATPSNVPAALAAKAATTTIPIVFNIAGDPVEAGLVASRERPGGNITGIRLEGQGYLFSEAVPASSILALLKPAPLASTTA